MIFNRKIFAFILICVITASCSDFLDVAPKEFYTEVDLFADMKEAEKELSVLYNRLPFDFNATDGDNGMILSATSDEGYHNWDQAFSRFYDGGSWNAANNYIGNYNEQYKKFRIAYHFLENIDKVPIKNTDLIDKYKNVLIPRYKAEAKFMIAFNYFELFKRYGAVPIVDHYILASEGEAVLKMPRNSVDEVVDFIVKLCDESSLNLPETYEAIDYGRVTKGAALALKAKTLLYAASPLFNGGEVDGSEVVVDGLGVKSTLLGIKNNDGKALFNTIYDKEKWKKAADAAKVVIDMAEKSNLYKLNPVQNELFYTRNYTEVIFWKQGGGSDNWEQFIMPNGHDYAGYGALSPPQEMINSYEMKNGYPITDSNSGYVLNGFKDTTMLAYRNNKWTNVKAHIRSMYMNRDPRFYTDQFFNGMPYLGRNIITENLPALGVNQDGWGKSGQNSRTGYYIKKWVAPTQDLKGQVKVTSYRNMPIIRLAEVYLWYAEALNEYAGPSDEVYRAINIVRKRVAMPELPIQGRAQDLTLPGLRERIRNERKIELAYEGHRFFDIRRWLIAHTAECKAVTGLSINSSGEDFYVQKAVLQNGRIFRMNHYLMPFPTNEISIAPALIQNYGWTSNTEK